MFSLLDDVTVAHDENQAGLSDGGEPVFLTKNGHGRYAVLDMEEYRQYEKLMAIQKLMTELDKGRRSGQEQGYISAENVEKERGIHD